MNLEAEPLRMDLSRESPRGDIKDTPQRTHHTNICMAATKVCYFSQIEFKSKTFDIFAPNGGGVFSLMWNTMNRSDEHFWHWVKFLKKKKKSKQVKNHDWKYNLTPMLFTGNQISAREITRILIIKIVTILLPIYIPDYSAIKNFSNFLLLRVTQVNY